MCEILCRLGKPGTNKFKARPLISLKGLIQLPVAKKSTSEPTNEELLADLERLVEEYNASRHLKVLV